MDDLTLDFILNQDAVVVCPTCGQPPKRIYTEHWDGSTVEFMCPNKHLWTKGGPDD